MSDAQQKPQVLVLGAGLAGLSAALTVLQTKSCHVTILEKASVPGGMAISLQVGGITTDLGPHRIYSTIPEMRAWFQQFLSDEILEVKRVSRMFVRGRYLRYPPDPLELARILGPLTMSRYAAGYLLSQVRALAGKNTKESFASVMEQRFGRPLCELLVLPYARKVWRISPDQVSPELARARATMGSVGSIARRLLGKQESPGSESSLKKFHYVQGGIGTIAAKLCEKISALGGRIICEADVKHIALSGNRVTNVSYATTDGKTHSINADFVFSTIPVTELTNALSDLNALDAQIASTTSQNLRYLNSILVFLCVRRPRLSTDQWLYFPEENPCFNRAYESKNFSPDLGPADRTLLCVEGTALSEDAAWKQPDDEIIRKYIEGIASTGLLRQDEVREAVVHRIEKAYPLYELGYDDQLNQIWTLLRKIPNLISLGRQGLFLHNNMDHSIHSGMQAARYWSERSNPAQDWYDSIEEFRNLRIVD